MNNLNDMDVKLYKFFSDEKYTFKRGFSENDHTRHQQLYKYLETKIEIYRSINADYCEFTRPVVFKIFNEHTKKDMWIKISSEEALTDFICMYFPELTGYCDTWDIENALRRCFRFVPEGVKYHDYLTGEEGEL
jgi:hypothetical protein